jgi:hypothetical protein
MQEALTFITSHPFSVMQIFMSLWGAFGVVVFFWGFIGYFLSHGHIEHQDHARSQMTWGFLLTGAAILVWEGIRWLAGLF